MSGDQLDLDAIEAWAEDFPRYGLTGSDRQLIDEDVPALVAEVRRLRAQVESAATEMVSIAAVAVRTQGEPDPDVTDSRLRHLSRRAKALADGLRE